MYSKNIYRCARQITEFALLLLFSLFGGSVGVLVEVVEETEIHDAVPHHQVAHRLKKKTVLRHA